MRTLFDEYDPRFLARRTDPPTSKLAAEEMIEHLAKCHAWALDCVTESPGWTANELGARYCVADVRRINRRLPELERLGLVVRGDERACRRTGRKCVTWWPKEIKP
jgi:hypothetical protein